MVRSSRDGGRVFRSLCQQHELHDRSVDLGRNHGSLVILTGALPQTPSGRRSRPAPGFLCAPRLNDSPSRISRRDAGRAEIGGAYASHACCLPRASIGHADGPRTGRNDGPRTEATAKAALVDALEGADATPTTPALTWRPLPRDARPIQPTETRIVFAVVVSPFGRAPLAQAKAPRVVKSIGALHGSTPGHGPRSEEKSSESSRRK